LSIFDLLIIILYTPHRIICYTLLVYIWLFIYFTHFISFFVIIYWIFDSYCVQQLSIFDLIIHCIIMPYDVLISYICLIYEPGSEKITLNSFVYIAYKTLLMKFAAERILWFRPHFRMSKMTNENNLLMRAVIWLDRTLKRFVSIFDSRFKAFLANCPRGRCSERNQPWVSEDDIKQFFGLSLSIQNI